MFFLFFACFGEDWLWHLVQWSAQILYWQADVVSVVMNRKMFMVRRLVLCHAWDTKVLVVSLDTDLCV